MDNLKKKKVIFITVIIRSNIVFFFFFFALLYEPIVKALNYSLSLILIIRLTMNLGETVSAVNHYTHIRGPCEKLRGKRKNIYTIFIIIIMVFALTNCVFKSEIIVFREFLTRRVN